MSLAAIAAWGAIGFAGDAQAALLAYDPFVVGSDPSAGHYVAGNIETGDGLLGGQNPTIGPDNSFYAGGWVQSGGDGSVVRNNPSLTYPGLPNGGIGLVRANNRFECCTFERNGRPFGDVFGLGQNGLSAGRDPNTLWGSFLIDWGTLGTNSDNGNQGKHGFEMWSASPAENADNNLVLDLYFNYYAGVDRLSLRWGPGGNSVQQVVAGNYTRDELAAINNGTHLVVLKLDFGDENGEDRVTMWLDPPHQAAVPSASLALPAGSVSVWGHSAFSAFQFDGGGSNPGAIDEFRWGTTIADVTPGLAVIPEPSACALALLGAIGLLMSRRER